MTQPHLQLALPPGIDQQRFLREYWQKKPLLMRGALHPDVFAVEADELAGLACEAEIESRLIIQQGERDWAVRHGPFDDDDFASLPGERWTLLVQDVDKFLPEVGALIEAFDFVPSWRIDDIMISYATDQGGVGPHTDAYDVFLMQAAGRRRWRLSHRDYSDSDLIPGLEQRILAHFDTDEEWVLEPGDVLYLPPGVAHWGIAEGECMTYSLGFRAPSQRELAADWFQYLIGLSDERRLDDPNDLSPGSLAELSDGVFHNAAQLLRRLPDASGSDFQRWLGCYLTEPKPQFHILPPDEPWTSAQLAHWLSSGYLLTRHPAARLAWAKAADGGVSLFCAGDRRQLPATLEDAVRCLAERRSWSGEHYALFASAQARSLLLDLINEGHIEPGDTA